MGEVSESPKPWRAEQAKRGARTWIISDNGPSCDDDDCIVAQIDGYRPKDAALISAAPDLLEALEQLLDDMGEDGLSVCQEAKDQARAAISKAKGETT